MILPTSSVHVDSGADYSAVRLQGLWGGGGSLFHPALVPVRTDQGRVSMLPLSVVLGGGLNPPPSPLGVGPGRHFSLSR